MPVGFKANGNIKPHRFVKQDTTTTGCVLQASTGDKMIGVSQPGQRNVPFAGLQDGYAAVAGEDVAVFMFNGSQQDGGNIMLQLGTGGATNGDSLKSDSDGCGVTTTSTGDWVGAVALGTGIVGDFIPVELISPNKY